MVVIKLRNIETNIVAGVYENWGAQVRSTWPWSRRSGKVRSPMFQRPHISHLSCRSHISTQSVLTMIILAWRQAQWLKRIELNFRFKTGKAQQADESWFQTKWCWAGQSGLNGLNPKVEENRPSQSASLYYSSFDYRFVTVSVHISDGDYAYTVCIYYLLFIRVTLITELYS